MKSFEQLLQGGHSKENALYIVESIIKDPKRLEELMALFFHNEMRLCQRASWPVGLLSEKHQLILTPYLPKMLKNLDEPKHDAVVRNTLRSWCFMKGFPEELEGEIYDRCFQYLTDTNRPTGIRMFAMVVVSNIAMKYPELKEEVIPVLEEHMPYGTSGFTSRARRELIRLRKA